MKISTKISAVLTLLCVILSSAALAQTNTPYSMYGYGLLGDRATSMQRQMGGVGFAMNSGRQINVMNPASYAFADSLTFLWDMGADISFIHSAEDAVKKNQTGGGLDYLTLQVPLSKYIGASAGLLPLSSVGYSFGNEIEHGTMSNQGSGGLNELYLGVAGRVKGLSVGVNISYLFGNIVNDVYSTPSGSGRTLFEHVMQIRDWNVNIGAQYGVNFSKADRLTLGFTYSPKKTFLGKTWVTNQNLGDNTALPDTVAYMKMRNNYYKPNEYGVGVNYQHTGRSYFMIEADFSLQQWADAKYSALYSSEGQLVFRGMDFNDRYHYAIGGEFSPKIRGNYFQRMRYRIGGYYNRDYLVINGNKLKDYGLSCGFGFPTPEGKTMINLGFEWKHRVASPDKLISENYYSITLGVNFNELWFWQRKIK